jgi:hypothetical protein
VDFCRGNELGNDGTGASRKVIAVPGGHKLRSQPFLPDWLKDSMIILTFFITTPKRRR